MPVKYQKSDSRIIGTWKSNRNKTMEFWSFPKRARFGPKKKEKWAEMFGKMTWKVTKNRLYSEYDGFKKITKYNIVASDSNSVVLELSEVILDELNEFNFFEFESKLLQIHFEGKDLFSISDGYNHEFFERIKT